MKSIIRRIVCVLAVAALALGVGAAADGQDVVSVTVDHCVHGGEYIFMLCKSNVNVNSISAGDILFVDQLSANSAGRINAAVVFPGFTSCSAVVGGTFSDGSSSPKKLGVYTASYMPGSLNDVGEEAFVNTAFTHVYLGDSVVTIGARAFADCDDLMYVYIPSSVRSIAPDAFSGSGSVTIGCQAGSLACDFAQYSGIPYVLVNG